MFNVMEKVIGKEIIECCTGGGETPNVGGGVGSLERSCRTDLDFYDRVKTG